MGIQTGPIGSEYIFDYSSLKKGVAESIGLLKQLEAQAKALGSFKVPPITPGVPGAPNAGGGSPGANSAAQLERERQQQVQSAIQLAAKQRDYATAIRMTTAEIEGENGATKRGLDLERQRLTLQQQQQRQEVASARRGFRGVSTIARGAIGLEVATQIPALLEGLSGDKASESLRQTLSALTKTAAAASGISNLTRGIQQIIPPTASWAGTATRVVGAIGAVGLAITATSAVYDIYHAKLVETVQKEADLINQTAGVRAELALLKGALPEGSQALLQGFEQRVDALKAQEDVVKKRLQEQATGEGSGSGLFGGQSVSEQALAQLQLKNPALSAGFSDIQRQIDATRQEFAQSLPFIVQYGSDLEGLIAKLRSGTAGAGGFARELQAMTNVPALPLATALDQIQASILKGVPAAGLARGALKGYYDALPLAQKLNLLTLAQNNLIHALSQHPSPEGVKEISGELEALGQEIARLQAQSPIVINAQMHLQIDQMRVQVAQAITAQNAQAQSQLDQLAEQHATAQANFSRQAGKAWSGYLQQRGRALRDEGREEAKAAEEHSRKLADISADAARDIERIQRESHEKLRQEQREFDIDSTRNVEDFNERRRELLAKGDQAGVAKLTRDFEKEQRRRKEDFARKKSDTLDDTGDKISDRQAQRDLSIKQEQESFARQRQERRAALALQLADMREAAQQQQAEIGQQQADEQREYQKGQAKTKADLARFTADQIQKLEEYQNHVRAVAKELPNALSPEQAETKVALAQIKNQWAGNLDDLKKIFGTGGTNAGYAWKRGFIDQISDAKRGTKEYLDDLKSYLIGQSPPPKGPLSRLDVGGANVGRAWTAGFLGAIRRAPVEAGLDEFRRQLQRESIVHTSGGRRATGAAGNGTGGAGQSQQIRLVLEMRPTDGKALWEVVAQHGLSAAAGNLVEALDLVGGTSSARLSSGAFRPAKP